MIKINLTKLISSSLLAISVMALNPINANASWKHDNKGWWYSIESYAKGWTKIDGKWYYFNPDGYMAHDTTIDSYRLGSDGAWIDHTTALTSTSNEKMVDITVGTAEEFVNAIGSNKRIILKPGVYNLSNINQNDKADRSITWETVLDGKELNIQDIHNLTIEGMDSGKVEINISPRYANIMNFTNVQNITIKNIIAGHTPSPYECDAGVLNFNNSNDISIINSELYGCGSIGLDLNTVKRLEVSNCKIDHCSLRALNIINSGDIKFTDDKIVNHEALSNIIMVNKSSNITFEKCELADNNNFGWSFIEATENSSILLNKCTIKNNSQTLNPENKFSNIYFINTSDYSGISNSKVVIKDSVISNNKCDYKVSNNESVNFENCSMDNNSWE